MIKKINAIKKNFYLFYIYVNVSNNNVRDNKKELL